MVTLHTSQSLIQDFATTLNPSAVAHKRGHGPTGLNLNVKHARPSGKHGCIAIRGTQNDPTLASRRGRGPSALDLNINHARPTKKEGISAVRGTSIDSSAFFHGVAPAARQSNLQVPVDNTKPIHGSLAGKPLPPLPAAADRKSANITVTLTSPSNNSPAGPQSSPYIIWPPGHPRLKRSLPVSTPAEPNMLTRIMAKSPFARTPGLLKATASMPALVKTPDIAKVASSAAVYSPVEPVIDSAGSRSRLLQVPKTAAFLKKPGHHRRGAMSGTPPLESVFKPKPARFNDKGLRPLHLGNIHGARPMGFGDVIVKAFEAVKRFVVGLGQDVGMAAARARDGRGYLDIEKNDHGAVYGSAGRA